MRSSNNRMLWAVLAVATVSLWPRAVVAQEDGGFKVAVIDSDRIVAESIRGQAVLEKMKKLHDQKLEEGKKLQQELKDLQERIQEGQLSLTEEKLKQLTKAQEDKQIALQRFETDANRELNKVRDEELDKIEADVIKVIDQVGEEQGFTMIFNKFRSGLVYAKDSIDITDEIIKRFNAQSQTPEGGG
jgi:outer membrane protein